MGLRIFFPSTVWLGLTSTVVLLIVLSSQIFQGSLVSLVSKICEVLGDLTLVSSQLGSNQEIEMISCRSASGCTHWSRPAMSKVTQ